MLGVALCLSAIAAFYSIIGLTAIFAAAVVPVAIMGTVLEIAKLTVTVWLHEYWHRCRRLMKVYLVPAVGVLMLITSMGIFGFLSKAHLDQAVPAGDVSAQVAIYDDKIRTQRDNIETARTALRQLDAAVDQQMARSTDEQGAQRAANLRRQQGAERNRLNQDISRAQTEIVKLQEQRAPVAAQARKVEAEVGPIKYIAALIYGDNPDANLLEKAVRWVIIILVIVFDPLAIFMLLAATESYKWEKYGRGGDPEEQTGSPPESPVLNRVNQWRDRWQQWRTKNAIDNVDAVTTPNMDERSAGDPVDSKPVAEVVEQSSKQTRSEIKYQIIDDADDEISLSTPVKEREPRITMGNLWPPYSHKGDLFIKTSTLPTTLFKFNDDIWVSIDKKQNDLYYQYDEYIDYLVSKISSGEYDPELLTDEERDQIETKLKKGI